MNSSWPYSLILSQGQDADKYLSVESGNFCSFKLVGFTILVIQFQKVLKPKNKNENMSIHSTSFKTRKVQIFKNRFNVMDVHSYYYY